MVSTAPKDSDAPARYEAGQTNAHDIHDSKYVLYCIMITCIVSDERCRDSRGLFDRAEAEKKQEAQEEERERELSNRDPTAPAKAHGNRPSRGAEIDKELQEDDKLRLKEKGLA